MATEYSEALEYNWTEKLSGAIPSKKESIYVWLEEK